MVTVDTTVFDGHLEALKALHAAVAKSCERLPDNEFGRNWRYMAGRLNDAITDVECGDECPTVAVAWTLDGGMCADCMAPATGPNEDADYEEAVGK